MKSKKYYVVVTIVDNSGWLSCSLVDIITADSKPESEYKCTPRKDIYTDYFSSKKAAADFVKQSLIA